MSSNDDIMAGIAELVHEIAGLPADQITPDATFTGSLDLDSLTMVEIFVAAEEKFDVRIPDEEAAELSSVGDAVAYIAKAQQAAGSPA